ncbi:hypothetical protein [Calothrix sp. PCC 6303]|uniref:hypothetical protein n=1 Tax=Calothrix sp. PCC 6303 TaxID=1170562 RepID=UPI0002A01835|nr:hypothetical protein [Calothrix sp. PCC 6303]AFZ00998.1 hypothetical protein Cal6303_1964 [Calothrix sp. PCC 6303]
MKYFFLSEGWTVGRVWSFDGLWQVMAWRREPKIERMDLCLIEESEVLWLYCVEDAIITIEVKPSTPVANQTIGQVTLKRLISAEQVLERLANGATSCAMENFQAVIQ